MVAQLRTYEMSLEQFERYLRDKHEELDQCIKEVQEAQDRLRAEFQHELEVWQSLYSTALPQVVERRAELPADLRAYLDRIEAEELAKLQTEMQELEAKLATGRREIDGYTEAAQEAARALRASNPDLDQREEALKRRVTELQDAYTEAYQELARAREPFMGWLTNSGAIGRARRRQREIKAEQAKAVQQLRTVRQDWLAAVQQTGETQGRIREQWQQTAIDTAEHQARYDHVRNNTADLAQQNGLQRSLSEMTEAPAMDDALGQTLADLSRHNQIRDTYEQALAAVSETAGLLRGISTGLGKFHDSVNNVVAEKRRYSLADVEIEVSQQVAVINQTWAQLAQQVRDEEQAVRAPLEFAAIARQHVIDRLTPAIIQRYFEDMGEALNRGTKKWA